MTIPLLTIVILWQAAFQPGVHVDAIKKVPGNRREITHFSADAIPALIEALAGEDAQTRDWASTALGKIGKAAVPALPGDRIPLFGHSEPENLSEGKFSLICSPIDLALCGGLGKSRRILAGEVGMLLTVALVYAPEHPQAAGVALRAEGRRARGRGQ